MTVRESIWLTLDDDLHRALRTVATAKNVTLHEAARIAMRLGVELMQRPRGAQR